MHITIIIPPSAFLLDDRAFPFLGPLQIAAVARERGHEVQVIDLTGYKRRHPEVIHAKAEDVLQEAIDQLLFQMQPNVDMVGFYCLTAQHAHVVALHQTVKAFFPKVVTVIGGPHASSAPEHCSADGFDWVIVADQGGGGGESGFIHLLDDLSNGKPRRSLIHGKILKIPSRQGAEWEGDLWPFPARDLIDLKSYHYVINGERCTQIISMTGCPYACTYCSHWEGYRKLEGKSAERVREEIRLIKNTYGWRAIMFYDDELNLRPDFTTHFLPMLKEEGIIWRAFFKNGPKLTREDIFQKMAEAGCVQICTGAESANPGILKSIKKGATVEDNTKFVQFAVKYGIAPKVFTQVGLPGETPETVEELASWLERMADIGLRDADTSITTPFFGTPIFNEPEKHQIHFDKEAIEQANETINYKGVPGEYMSFVWHDRLSRDDLVKSRQMVEDRFRKRAGLPPLIAKDDG